MILFLKTHKLKSVCLSSACVLVCRLSAISARVWRGGAADWCSRPCDLKAAVDLQPGPTVGQSRADMQTLRWTLWNFRRLILILAAPLLLLPLPLVIGTKVSGRRRDDE